MTSFSANAERVMPNAINNENYVSAIANLNQDYSIVTNAKGVHRHNSPIIFNAIAENLIVALPVIFVAFFRMNMRFLTMSYWKIIQKG